MAVARSSTVMPSPISVASPPRRAAPSGRSVTSTAIRAIETRPATGHRLSAMITSAGALPLAAARGMVGRLGAGQMAPQHREPVTFRRDARRDGDGLVDGGAEPVHAGIDVERRAATPFLGRDESVPLRKLGRAVDDRPQIVVG